MKNFNTITFMSKTFERAYEEFLTTDKIHHSTKEVSLLAFEKHLGIVHVADFKTNDRYTQYRIENKDKFRFGKIKFNL